MQYLREKIMCISKTFLRSNTGFDSNASNTKKNKFI